MGYRRIAAPVAFGGVCLALLLLPFGAAHAAFTGYNGDTPEVAYDDGSNVHSTGAGTASIAGATDPAWSPDGTKLAFVKGGKVHVADPDGSNELGTPVAGSKPAWSPDGTKIAYVGTDGDIYVKDVTGSTGTDVTNSVADDEDPAWSPDGSQIAFARKAGGGSFSLWVMNASGSGQTQLTSGSSNDVNPAWSPDGGTIAFQSDRDGSEQIYTMSSGGGNATRLTSGSSADAIEPTYSPQGDLIAFARPGTGLREVGSDGSNETSLTSGGSDENPDFRAFAPRNDAPPDIEGTFQVGQTVDAVQGSWTGATGSFTYQWARCSQGGGGCTDIPGATDSTYVLVSADQNNQLIVRETASNAGGLTTTADSHFSPVVGGAGPQIIDLPTITLPSTAIDGAPVVGSALFASTGTWQSGDFLTFTYQWKKCELKNGPCFTIKGATLSSFTPTVDQVGWEIRVGVTAHSDHGDPEVNSLPTKAVTGLAPVLHVTPPIVGTNMVGQQLSVSTGTWTGTLPITFTFDWRRCDPFGNLSTCVSIPGTQTTSTVAFSTSTYTLTDADLNQTIRVYITGKNAIASFTGVTNHTFPTLPKQRFAPAPTSPPTITGNTHPGAKLVADIGQWSGDAPISYKTSWQRCDATAGHCKTLETQHRLSYVVQRRDLGRTFLFTVVATNPIGSVPSVSEPTLPVTLTPKPKRGRHIVGTNGPDYLPGGGGNDTIIGRGGNDTIVGGAGNDLLEGGAGDDVIDGGPGRDRIFGGKGSDTIIAADGTKDVVDCGPGEDRAFADPIDVLRGCEVVTYSAPTAGTLRRR